jgi:hypothetical protein
MVMCMNSNILKVTAMEVPVMTICACLKVVSGLLICFAQAMVSTHKGDVIMKFHQMVPLVKSKHILLCIQTEVFGDSLNNQS